MSHTSSEAWGGGSADYGKYSVKLYTIDGVLIYQAENGGDNTAKVPLGGVVATGFNASSMIEAIANPITFYNVSGEVINQAGHSKDLYNYYWTSYSRGVDGSQSNTKWHNAYLDGYIPLRAKSIYDPCPYLYRIPSNGTYNQIISNAGWTTSSYLGGVSWNLNTLGISWLPGLGRRGWSPEFSEFAREGSFWSSTIVAKVYSYSATFYSTTNILINRSDRPHILGWSVRCIEGLLHSEWQRSFRMSGRHQQRVLGRL